MKYATLSKIIPFILPGTWKIKTKNKKIFLTFDDGPIPEVTLPILEILNHYNIKGTFFCVGDNVRKHPNIFDKILKQGHAVGNHTYSHLKGWNTDNKTYIKDIEKANTLVRTKLFRPPYGKIKPMQAKMLKKMGYKIIMWSILSMDFHKSYSPNKCYQNVIKHTKPGSIIVFHDNIKAKENVLTILPKIIDSFIEKGFNFAKL